MMQFAAYVAKKYDYLSKPSDLFLQSGNWPTLSRELMLLSMLPQLRKTRAAQPHTTDAWLANSQIMVAATDRWLVAAKGGHNNESHNHNDVGSFVVYSNGAPVLIDLGRDTYTSQTFSSRRFELMNNRSLYHNVPLINGCEQHDGREYKALGAEHTANDTASILTLDIAKAYPKEAQAERWKRSIVMNRKRDRVEVTEDFRIVKSADRPTEITLMCYGEPRMLQPGRVALADGPSFAFDYYSSYVFHPMYLETLQAMVDAKANTRLDYQKYYDRELKRCQKYSIVLERFIAPDGTFPVFGRSIPYRMATMQPLALMAWYQTLPKDLSNGQVRAALTKVLHRMFDQQQNFNEGGYLTIGFCGHQPNVADWYTNNGSLYMTTLAFMPLGLPATHPFWTDAAQPWTQVKAWNGEAFPKDHHWGDDIVTKDKW